MAGLVAVSVHTLATLSVMAGIATTAYEWVGLAVLRGAWLNIDLLWVTALVATAAVELLLSTFWGISMKYGYMWENNHLR